MKDLADFIKRWLIDYLKGSKQKGFVVGVSGGIDSALTATLCSMTGKNVLLVNLPLRQNREEIRRSSEQIQQLVNRFQNVDALEIDLTKAFDSIENSLPDIVNSNGLAMANSRSRLRMLTLYALAQSRGYLVVGTGNKVEDFGIGFFTKYGDGGVDLSPIADINKTQVFKLAEFLGVEESVLNAKPTDGLWGDDRTDEDQIGATYPELEWAMDFKGDESLITNRQKEVLQIYRKFHSANNHKMIPIPVCKIPKDLLKKF